MPDPSKAGPHRSLMVVLAGSGTHVDVVAGGLGRAGGVGAGEAPPPVAVLDCLDRAAKGAGVAGVHRGHRGVGAAGGLAGGIAAGVSSANTNRNKQAKNEELIRHNKEIENQLNTPKTGSGIITSAVMVKIQSVLGSVQLVVMDYY